MPNRIGITTAFTPDLQHEFADCPHCHKRTLAGKDSEGNLLWYPYEGQQTCPHYEGMYQGAGCSAVAYFALYHNS